jgi:hypothetical protein
MLEMFCCDVGGGRESEILMASPHILRDSCSDRHISLVVNAHSSNYKQG